MRLPMSRACDRFLQKTTVQEPCFKIQLKGPALHLPYEALSVDALMESLFGRKRSRQGAGERRATRRPLQRADQRQRSLDLEGLGFLDCSFTKPL